VFVPVIGIRAVMGVRVLVNRAVVMQVRVRMIVGMAWKGVVVHVHRTVFVFVR
jgi:hypothetical protein